MRLEAVVPVILAGGQGLRLRPLTAPTRPKPFLKIFSGRSLLQHTMQRAAEFSHPLIICAEDFAAQALEEAREIGVHAKVLAEPSQQGTAAAIACAAVILREKNPLILVMPSDHFIEDAGIFAETVWQAAEIVPDNGPVILGVPPEGPRERYGYIRTEAGAGYLVLQSFVEKPSVHVARKLWQEPGVFWNTGIFLCRASVLIDLLARHAPDILAAAEKAMRSVKEEDEICCPDARDYTEIPSRPIDRAVMERLGPGGGMVLPLETGWHDVGCWERLLALKTRSFARKMRLPRRYEFRQKKSGQKESRRAR